MLAAAGVSGDKVRGVGFDATCSLAVVDQQGTPLSISRSVEGGKEDDANLGKDGEWNVVLWADHRAEEEAEAINATEEGVLGFVGETMSVSLLQTLLAITNLEFELMPVARDGNPQGIVVEKQHAERALRSLQVLRPR